MNTTAEVYLWGTRVGIIHQELDKPYASFEYDGDYWHNIPAMRKRDKLKDKICKDKNIFLIRVKECEWCNNNLKTKNMIKQILNDKIYG